MTLRVDDFAVDDVAAVDDFDDFAVPRC